MFIRLQNSLATALFHILLCTFGLGFPELSIRLRFQAIPELEEFLHAFIQPSDSASRRRRLEGKKLKDDAGKLANDDAPMMLGTADLAFLIEYQRDSDSESITNIHPFDKNKDLALGETIQTDEPLPKFAAQFDNYFPGGGRMLPNQGIFGGQNPYGHSAGDTVNFDFQCKCQAKSALARTMNTPLSSDPNQAAQQQIQQLQEQVRKLQDQINRSQQGKSSFEQFAQMLSLADGLDCSCSGQSTPWNGWPSGVPGGANSFGNPFGGGRMIGGGGPLSQMGGMNGGGLGGGHFIPMPMPMGGGRQIGGGQFGGTGHPMFPGGYPIRMARQTGK